MGGSRVHLLFHQGLGFLGAGRQTRTCSSTRRLPYLRRMSSVMLGFSKETFSLTFTSCLLRFSMPVFLTHSRTCARPHSLSFTLSTPSMLCSDMRPSNCRLQDYKGRNFQASYTAI